MPEIPLPELEGTIFDYGFDTTLARAVPESSTTFAPVDIISISQTDLGIYTSFTLWTPTWTTTAVAPAFGNATLACRYTQIGKLVVAKILITFGSTSTYGTGNWRFSLPITSADETTAIGVMRALDSGVSEATQFVYMIGTTTVTGANAVGAQLSATTPHIWGSADVLSMTFSYEAL